MPLSKRQGNMYDWVTHTWSCLQGQCPHECSYCYVKNGHWTKDNPAYKGEPRLETNFDQVKLGHGKVIFVAHTSDLFAQGVPSEAVHSVLSKCTENYRNRYVFQTKDPENAWKYRDEIPPTSTIGTTIETDSFTLIGQHSKAPNSVSRSFGIGLFRNTGLMTFLTIEPIMKFNLGSLLFDIEKARPSWVNIGADSKGCNLPEPTWEEVQDLIKGIRDLGIEIREKSNLDRLRRDA